MLHQGTWPSAGNQHETIRVMQSDIPARAKTVCLLAMRMCHTPPRGTLAIAALGPFRSRFVRRDFGAHPPQNNTHEFHPAHALERALHTAMRMAHRIGRESR